MKIDRLRGLSIGCIAIAAVAIVLELFTPTRSGTSLFVMVLLLLGVALEKIRLELCDLREELMKKIAEQQLTPHESI